MNYIHADIPELSVSLQQKGNIQIRSGDDMAPNESIRVVNTSLSIARRIGIDLSYKANSNPLPYLDSHLLFSAPFISACVQRPIVFLRGWKQFESCIKGFNALGLVGEVITRELAHYNSLPHYSINQRKIDFLKTRKKNGKSLYTESELHGLNEADLLEVPILDIAIWSAFAQKPIVCSTSSNMGITLHQILRLIQNTGSEFLGRHYQILNSDEGKLIIWCPDERADFMNAEKTAFLRAIESEEPRITSLHTYVNRQQRDPGALRDALTMGGYFFPTNPQSKDEMQNLFFVALKDLANENGTSLQALISQPNIQSAIQNLGYGIQNGAVIIEHGIVSGMQGLMIPYFIMLEELLHQENVHSVSAWNQASIGAALAAAVLADEVLKYQHALEDNVRSEFNSFFPRISAFLDAHRMEKDFPTRIHGLFDVANLQSLAQLLGVVVENHMAGRGTAYVGLGSSSYSNGNKCFEILQKNIEEKGAFAGKKAFHPATHAINSIAQALVYGEDLVRYLRYKNIQNGPISKATLGELRSCVRKPEPAGAAALAGYLLARLDRQSLSIVEIAFLLRMYGFSSTSFLNFAGYGEMENGPTAYIQLAREEGNRMGSMAQNFMVLLDFKIERLKDLATHESFESRTNNWANSLDDTYFEILGGPVSIYLTGDNCLQPSTEFCLELAENCINNLPYLSDYLKKYEDSKNNEQVSTPMSALAGLIDRIHKVENFAHETFQVGSQKLLKKLVKRGQSRK
jgi:hypothetical protein